MAQREALRVSWYTSIGAWREAASGRSGGDLGTSTANTWTAPSKSGKGWWWLVIRDERGGVSWRTVQVTVAD